MRRETGPRKAGAFEAAKAVFWAFLGVRKGQDYQKDSLTLTPVQVIAAGLVGVSLLVLVLLALVTYLTG